MWSFPYASGSIAAGVVLRQMDYEFSWLYTAQAQRHESPHVVISANMGCTWLRRRSRFLLTLDFTRTNKNVSQLSAFLYVDFLNRSLRVETFESASGASLPHIRRDHRCRTLAGAIALGSGPFHTAQSKPVLFTRSTMFVCSSERRPLRGHMGRS